MIVLSGKGEQTVPPVSACIFSPSNNLSSFCFAFSSVKQSQNLCCCIFPGIGGSAINQSTDASPSTSDNTNQNNMLPPTKAAEKPLNGTVTEQPRLRTLGSLTTRTSSTSDIRKLMMEDMPMVSSKVEGPNTRRIDGFLYRYKKGEDVRIVCVCHGSFLTPAEFVKHAGGGDVSNPLRHIVVNPAPFSWREGYPGAGIYCAVTCRLLVLGSSTEGLCILHKSECDRKFKREIICKCYRLVYKLIDEDSFAGIGEEVWHLGGHVQAYSTCLFFNLLLNRPNSLQFLQTYCFLSNVAR